METTPFINVFVYAVLCGLAVYCAIMFVHVVRDLSYNSTRKQLQSKQFYATLLLTILCASLTAALALIAALQALKYAFIHVLGG